MRKVTKGRPRVAIEVSTQPKFIKKSFKIKDVKKKAVFINNKIRKNLKLIEEKKYKPVSGKPKEGQILKVTLTTVLVLVNNPAYKARFVYRDVDGETRFDSYNPKNREEKNREKYYYNQQMAAKRDKPSTKWIHPIKGISLSDRVVNYYKS